MRKRPIYLALLLLAVVVVGLFTASFFRNREPEYGGRKLSEWVDDLSDDLTSHTQLLAEDALRHIGTNALPFLLDSIDYHLPQWKERLYETSAEVLGGPPDGSWAEEGWRRAKSTTRAFSLITTNVSVVIPALERILFAPKSVLNAKCAALALARFGAPAVPSLLSAMTNAPDQYVRLRVVGILGGMGENGRPAGPLLTHFLESSNSYVAWTAANALSRLRLEPAMAVPALMKILQSTTNVIFQEMVLVALARFGPEARPAVSAVNALLNDPNTGVSGAARSALRQIDVQGQKGADP